MPPSPKDDTDFHLHATHLYVNVSSASQNVPMLKPGTAKKGRIGFGDTLPTTRRMKAGDRLVCLTHISAEAMIATLEGDTRELLILTAHLRLLA